MTPLVKLTDEKPSLIVKLFVCLLSMNYPVMGKHQQMTFTSQRQTLTVTCSLLSFWRGSIWLGNRNSYFDYLSLWLSGREVSRSI